MFSRKYNITLLDSKWNPIKNSIKFIAIPKRDEFVYLVDRYYQVINVVHNLANKNHDILVIIEELKQDKSIENEIVKKII
jgi:hypothetical protein